MLSYNENEENYYYNILLHTLAHLFQRGILYKVRNISSRTARKCVKLSAES